MVVAVAVPWLMACGDDDGAAPDPLPDPTTSSTGATGSGVLVELATSGGEDGRGIGDLTVTADGEAQRRDPQGGVERMTLSTDELGTLVAALDDADFAGAPAEPGSDDVCPDGLAYRVTYQEWQVTADSCTVPDEVAPAVEELQSILGRFG